MRSMHSKNCCHIKKMASFPNTQLLSRHSKRSDIFWSDLVIYHISYMEEVLKMTIFTCNSHSSFHAFTLSCHALMNTIMESVSSLWSDCQVIYPSFHPQGYLANISCNILHGGICVKEVKDVLFKVSLYFNLPLIFFHLSPQQKDVNCMSAYDEMWGTNFC